MSGGHGHGSDFVPRRFVLAQFGSSDSLLEGTRRMREKGHKKIDTHTPYPIHGLEEALGLGRPKIPFIVLMGAIAGVCAAYSMMYFMNVVDFPINVGNRPPHSVPAFIPITFELAVLLGGSASFFGLLIGLLKFPEPYHPLFESDLFSRASIDGFLLSVEVPEGQSQDGVLADVRGVGALKVETVEESER
jgi:hypothetical protein